MFLKEILSKEKHVLNEIVDKKVCNSKLYEKSYVRNVLLDSNRLHRVENNKQFFIEKKRRKRRKYYYATHKLKAVLVSARYRRRRKEQLIRRKLRRKIEKSKGQGPLHSLEIINKIQSREQFKKRGHKGNSSYTTIRIYKSRKSNFIRFEIAQFRICRPNQFVNLFLKGIRTLITGRIKERENSLILLNAEKGGFSCYSSGFRGFLPETQFNKMLKIGRKKCSKSRLAFKSLVEYQRFRWFVSSPPRLRFVIKTFTKVFRFRRNNFVLSRKKKSHDSTRLLPKIIFHSTNSSRKKTRAKLTGLELIKKFECFKRRI